MKQSTKNVVDQFFQTIRGLEVVRESDRWVGGVCSGLADRFGWKVAGVRAVFAGLGLLFGLGIVMYALLWMVLPDEMTGTIAGEKAVYERHYTVDFVGSCVFFGLGCLFSILGTPLITLAVLLLAFLGLFVMLNRQHNMVQLMKKVDDLHNKHNNKSSDAQATSSATEQTTTEVADETDAKPTGKGRGKKSGTNKKTSTVASEINSPTVTSSAGIESDGQNSPDDNSKLNDEPENASDSIGEAVEAAVIAKIDAKTKKYKDKYGEKYGVNGSESAATQWKKYNKWKQRNYITSSTKWLFIGVYLVSLGAMLTVVLYTHDTATIGATSAGQGLFLGLLLIISGARGKRVGALLSLLTVGTIILCLSYSLSTKRQFHITNITHEIQKILPKENNLEHSNGEDKPGSKR
jgi:phage shock protein PspC (stress-responsive transcriptional regulator)/23S rRNA maturation mini-RNase III